MSAAAIEWTDIHDTAEDVDPDGIEVYCSDSEAWSGTRDYFCESCGATDHDLG